MNPPHNAADREFVTSRVIEAPPEQVFNAIKDPTLLAQWWGPKGFRSTFHEFDFRPGGTWRFDMHGPDGTDYPNHNVFEEIAPNRVVVRHIDPVHAFSLAIALAPAEGGTRITWNQVFDSNEEANKVRSFVPRCNEEVLDRLAALVTK